MKRLAYHVTRHIKTLLKDGTVRPMRMKQVYLLRRWQDAGKYAAEFGGNGVIKVEFDTADVVGRGSRSYAVGGCITLKPGATARVVKQMVLRRPKQNIPKPRAFKLGGGIVEFSPRFIASRIDGRKGGGRSPRRRQLQIFGTLNRGYFASAYELPALVKYLKSVEKWIKDANG